MASSNTFLASLLVTAGAQNYPLLPWFNPINLRYRIYVPNGTTGATVTPWTDSSGSTVKVNGVTVTSGAASASITLKTGPNTAVITVTAADATSFLNYFLDIIVLAAAPFTTNYQVTKKEQTTIEVFGAQPPFLVTEVLYDGTYRDLPSSNPNFGTVPILVSTNPGPTPDVTPTFSETVAVTTGTVSYSDDQTHIEPRQLVYRYSFLEFVDKAGNLIGWMPWDTVEDVENLAPAA
jgi:hypothetical protein